MSVLLVMQVRQVVAVLLQVRQGRVQLRGVEMQIAAPVSLYPLWQVQVSVGSSQILNVVGSHSVQLLGDGPLQFLQVQSQAVQAALFYQKQPCKHRHLLFVRFLVVLLHEVQLAALTLHVKHEQLQTGQTTLPSQQYPLIQLHVLLLLSSCRLDAVGQSVHWVLMLLQDAQLQWHLMQQVKFEVVLQPAGQVVEHICSSTINFPAKVELMQIRQSQWMAQQLRYLKELKVRKVLLVHIKKLISQVLSTLNSPRPNRQLKQLKEAGLNVEITVPPFTVVFRVPKSMQQVQLSSSFDLSTTMIVTSILCSKLLLVVLSTMSTFDCILALTKYENSVFVLILKDMIQGATTAFEGSIIVTGARSTVVRFVFPGVSSNYVKVRLLLMRYVQGIVAVSITMYMQQSSPKMLILGLIVKIVLNSVVEMPVIAQLQSINPDLDVLAIFMSLIDMAARRILLLVKLALQICVQLRVIAVVLAEVVAVRSLWSPLLIVVMSGQLAI